MSLTNRYEYMVGRELEAKDIPFYALIQAAMRRADTGNLYKLQTVFSQVWAELQERYDTPGGYLKEELAEMEGEK